MGGVSGLSAILRSIRFYVIINLVYWPTALIVLMYAFLMLPVLLWNRKYVMRFINWFFFLSVHFSSLILNRGWKYTFINSLPKDSNKKARLLMFNHLSFADPFLLTSLGLKAPIVCTYKNSIHKLPTMYPILPLGGHMPIKFTYDKENDRKIATRECVKEVMKKSKWSIDNGFNVLVYPEGKRSRDGRLAEFKDGYFRFAIENGVEIVPGAISNSPKLWPLQNKVLIGEGLAYINIGKPISPKGKTLEELKLATRQAIYDLLRECPTFNPKLETVPELSDD